MRLASKAGSATTPSSVRAATRATSATAVMAPKEWAATPSAGNHDPD